MGRPIHIFLIEYQEKRQILTLAGIKCNHMEKQGVKGDGQERSESARVYAKSAHAEAFIINAEAE